MSNNPKSNNGGDVTKPNLPGQTRGQNPYSAPQKPVTPTPPSTQTAKPKKYGR